ncbi:FAD:protein FMN transferase [Shewanella sp. A25]|nr:FAD:protein FMN transferase [Shewanella shenzhenensis]
MASPCELLMATDDVQIAATMLKLAIEEVSRIEQKYSRFIPHNPLWQLNHGSGKTCAIDAETSKLLHFACQCFELSEGLFDVTAGPLMQLWRFDGSAQIPTQTSLDRAMDLVGFERLTLSETSLHMPDGMQLDLGGIAKEYAADSVAYLLSERFATISVLVNLGGDIACPVAKSPPWQVGIENPNKLDTAARVLSISKGALATSGDTRRFIEVDGKRYGHIIHPRTGYPVIGAPRSVTVIAPNCVTAGMLSTMAMLKGKAAEAFLAEQQLQFTIYR